MSYEITFPERILNGVQGVRGSNPRVPTKKINKKSGLGTGQPALFYGFCDLRGFV